MPVVVTPNDIPPHISRSKPYSMVIFPAAFIFLAYKVDSALYHMLTCYKVISVIGQSKFEVKQFFLCPNQIAIYYTNFCFKNTSRVVMLSRTSILLNLEI